MKVYIGPYKDTWITASFHYKYMNKKYKREWEESNTRFEKILEKLEDWCQSALNATVNKLVKHRKRKVKVHIDNYDTWGMDNTLAYIILPMLKQLKATKHGTPFVDTEDLPEHMHLSQREQDVLDHGYFDKTLSATEEEIKAADEKFQSQWDWVIDQMIWSFEQQLDEDDEHKNYYDPYELHELVEDEEDDIVVNEDGTTNKVKTLFNKEWKMKMGKFNKEKFDAYHKRKQLGYTLFGKYYQALWD